MASAFPLCLMVCAVVNDVGSVFRSIGRFALDVVAGDVWNAGDFQSSGVPARPAQEKVLSAFAFVAGKICVRQGPL